MSTQGRRISVGDGSPAVDVYLNESVSAEFGVIVLQEWWGLVPHIERVVDRFAAEGIAALAPDLYGGRIATAPDEAGKLMMCLQVETAANQIAAATEFLRSRTVHPTKKVGIIGFCMGGALALFSACRQRDIGACVVFYGSHPAVQPDISVLRAPVLGWYGGRDQYVTPRDVAALDAELTKLGKRHNFHVFPETGHAFFNEDSPKAYNAAAAKEAWQRTISFLKEELSNQN